MEGMSHTTNKNLILYQNRRIEAQEIRRKSKMSKKIFIFIIVLIIIPENLQIYISRATRNYLQTIFLPRIRSSHLARELAHRDFDIFEVKQPKYWLYLRLCIRADNRFYLFSDGCIIQYQPFPIYLALPQIYSEKLFFALFNFKHLEILTWWVSSMARYGFCPKN